MLSRWAPHGGALGKMTDWVSAMSISFILGEVDCSNKSNISRSNSETGVNQLRKSCAQATVSGEEAIKQLRAVVNQPRRFGILIKTEKKKKQKKTSGNEVIAN